MNIGMEFEFTGMPRKNVAIALKNYFHNFSLNTGICDDMTCPDKLCSRKYDIYTFIDNQNRVWSIGQDISIMGEKTDGDISNAERLSEDEIGFAYHDYLNEMQTPVLNSDNANDKKMISDVLTILQAIGCTTNSSCAFHLHIDAPKNEKELALYLYQYMQIQYEQYKLFDTEHKKAKYAKDYSVPVDCHGLLTLQDIYQYIYENYPNARTLDGKLDAKNFCINFAAVAEHNTIEFRAFNGTLCFDEVLKRIDYIKKFVDEVDYLKSHGWFGDN